MSTTYPKVAMSPGELPRQRLFQLLELPDRPDDFELLDYHALEKLQPQEPGQDASLIVQAEWAWSPMHNRVSNWEIGPDESDRYWVLWCSNHTDECEPAEWCEEEDEEDIEWVTVWCSEVVAACPRGNLCIGDASALLLRQAWDDERVDMELDPPHFYGATGILGIDALRSIERLVWEE